MQKIINIALLLTIEQFVDFGGQTYIHPTHGNLLLYHRTNIHIPAVDTKGISYYLERKYIGAIDWGLSTLKVLG